MSNLQTAKEFIKLYQERILFGVIIVLIAVISFRAGMIKEREQQSMELKVFLNNEQKLNVEDKKAIALGKAVQRKGLTETVESSIVSRENEKECQFVGSKNSDKYHTMSCQWASRIKPENIVCFESVEEAERRGYIPASCNK
ncbi:MAG: hypothetical protein KAQ63_01305 [Candidatus Moranbacteria bacterium]|nr:hypothetical protein [Candidatus Moranbacteria bacterium]